MGNSQQSQSNVPGVAIDFINSAESGLSNGPKIQDDGNKGQCKQLTHYSNSSDNSCRRTHYFHVDSGRVVCVRDGHFYQMEKPHPPDSGRLHLLDHHSNIWHPSLTHVCSNSNVVSISIQKRPKHSLPTYTYSYKFIVDGEWRFSPEDPTKPDELGNINNYIDTTNYKPLSSHVGSSIEASKSLMHNHPDRSKVSTSNKVVDGYKSTEKPIISLEQFNAKAPDLPVHFTKCTYLDTRDTRLNSLKKGEKMDVEGEADNGYNVFKSKCPELNKLSKEDLTDIFDSTHSLPPPTHVVLNHLTIKNKAVPEGMRVYSITHRFKSKYTTYTFYSHKKNAANTTTTSQSRSNSRPKTMATSS